MPPASRSAGASPHLAAAGAGERSRGRKRTQRARRRPAELSRAAIPAARAASRGAREACAAAHAQRGRPESGAPLPTGSGRNHSSRGGRRQPRSWNGPAEVCAGFPLPPRPSVCYGWNIPPTLHWVGLSDSEPEVAVAAGSLREKKSGFGEDASLRFGIRGRCKRENGFLLDLRATLPQATVGLGDGVSARLL